MSKAEEQGKSEEAFAKKWLNSISEAMTREKAYRTLGKKCVNLYEAKTPDKTPFAILYSNTETLLPAVYNARPIPIVDRRFKDADPIGRVAAEVSTRILKFEVDAESEDYDSFDELMQAGVLDAAVTNRGVTRYKYVPSIEGQGEEENLRGECVYGESVRWDKFFHGYARTWKKVPWIGFEWDMSKEELKDNFPDLDVSKIDFSNMELASHDQDTTSSESRQELTGVKLVRVYEIWNKASRKVMFFSDAWLSGPLKVVEDPLGLDSFFPVPKPLNFMKKITTLIPTPLYVQYEQQAKELNAITIRLKKLIEACKIRGFYNSTVDGIEKVLTSEENTLTPVENMQAMGDNPAADKLIWLMPIAEIVSAVQTLYAQREQVKQVIYEITGISDILRGASIASETATAQNIKNQWGTLRLKRMQKEVQRYCRDSLRIMLEIAVTKFSQETVAAMTGVALFRTVAEKQQVGQQIEQQKAMAAQQAQMAQQMGQQAPAAPPPIPPELAEMLSRPTWEEVLGALKNDVVRAYKVDIETNSTLDAEAAQDKQDISELLNALSQFLNGIAPLIEKGIMSVDVAKGILLTISRRYTFGPQLEEALEKMKEPAPQQEPPDPNAELKLQTEQMKLQGEQAQSQAEIARIQMEGQIAEQEHQARMAEMGMKQQIEQEKLAMEQTKLQFERARLVMQSEFAEKQHKMKMEQLRSPKPVVKKESA